MQQQRMMYDTQFRQQTPRVNGIHTANTPRTAPLTSPHNLQTRAGYSVHQQPSYQYCQTNQYNGFQQNETAYQNYQRGYSGQYGENDYPNQHYQGYYASQIHPQQRQEFYEMHQQQNPNFHHEYSPAVKNEHNFFEQQQQQQSQQPTQPNPSGHSTSEGYQEPFTASGAMSHVTASVMTPPTSVQTESSNDQFNHFHHFYSEPHHNPSPAENSNSSSDFNFLSTLANEFAPEYYQLS